MFVARMWERSLSQKIDVKWLGEGKRGRPRIGK